MNTPKIFIGIPRTGRWADPRVEHQRWRMVFRLIEEDLLLWSEPGEYPVYESLGTLPDIARNDIVRRFLALRQHEHDRLLMIDDDMTVPVGLGWRLLSWDVEVVAPLFFRRATLQPCWFAVEGTEKHYGEELPRFVPRFDLAERVAEALKKTVPVETAAAYMAVGELPRPERIDAVGAGVVMIRGDVFDKLSEPWFQLGLLGEDFWFSWKCHEAGIPLYADLTVACGHWHSAGLGVGDFRDNWGRIKAEMRKCEACGNPLELLAWPPEAKHRYSCREWRLHVPPKGSLAPVVSIKEPGAAES